ncbi:EpsD family peptidyl-prolyl cis-trans isomerase [Sphingomonas nostoxanthinifaciens]|uniref:EpsD family peptidyl-prolyl cis-trans isomerase n=1 Tax=Sphingomonas nostoxanthinifaciens TaxID=2872652 RepID=UPI001CC21E40|nr:EpsD family peptidyl-prolyl cis-trans isomerase [Sphingomonas nostoxanthinifaciens]UAK24144.1 EpsD family peptidyl-prolyl cis-trans isomerase [Sphingomonas nostoxanthinifaciens]
MSRRIGLMMACAAAALVAGCHKTPQGQVAATVNGDEVTLQEINTELQGANLPNSANKETAQRVLLQRVIDRKLLIGAAKDKGIDKSPEYLSEKRRADEMLLAQAYAKQQLAAVPLPTDAEINKFMTDHPTAFAGRELLSLDQVRFPPPKDLKMLSALDQDHTLDAVVAHLTAMGIKFERRPAGLDTAAAPAQLVKAINGLPAGEPFVVPAPGVITVSVVMNRKPMPTDPTQAKPAAVQAWRQQKFAELITQQIASLKSGAKISYQNGFGPPPAGSAPGAPGATPPAAAPAAEPK